MADSDWEAVPSPAKASASTDEWEPIAPEKKPMGGIEKALRAAKAGVSSATAGISDYLYNNSKANSEAMKNRPEGDLRLFGSRTLSPEEQSVKDESLKGEYNRQAEYESDNPWTANGARLVGAVQPYSVGGAIAKGVGAVTPTVGKGLAQWLKGTVVLPAAGAATAGIDTALSNQMASGAGASDDQLASVPGAMAMGAVIPLASQVASGAKQLVKTSAQGLAGMSDKVAKQYTENRPLVDKYADWLHGANPNPAAVQDEATSTVKSALSKMEERAKSTLEQKQAAMAGKQVNLPDGAFAETGLPAIDSEVAKIRAQYPTTNGALSLPAEVADALREKVGKETRFYNGAFGTDAVGKGKSLGGALKGGLNADEAIDAVNRIREADATIYNRTKKTLSAAPEKALHSGSIGVQARMQKLQDLTGVPVFDKNLAMQAAKAMDSKSSKNWLGIPVGNIGRAAITSLYKGEKGVQALSKAGINERNLLLGGLGLLNAPNKTTKDEDK